MEFTSPECFLYGLREYRDVEAKKIPNLFAGTNTFRVDVPVWFGDFQRSKKNILVYGREPRDTNKDFDIEKIDNRIYAAPFGCDRWNEKSSIKGRPQLKYFRTFKEIIEKQEVFIIFSDIVKYYIAESGNKSQNDRAARKTFTHLAKEEVNIEFLKEEIRLINPAKILGNKSYYFYKDNIALGDFHLIPHPSHGGERKAIREIRKVMLLL